MKIKATIFIILFLVFLFACQAKQDVISDTVEKPTCDENFVNTKIQEPKLSEEGLSIEEQATEPIVEPQEEEIIVQPVPPVEMEEKIEVEQEILQEEPTAEVTIEDAPPPKQEPISEELLEYERSINSTEEPISIETFTDDKAEILRIIDQLARVMKYKDYSTWLKYITPSSKAFWSNQNNLISISSRLPIKNYRLKNLQDYFEKVFIPSRQGRVVNEIRYISKTNIKAVQSTESQDIIYYYFEKLDDVWLLQLDTNL